jgi:hypothetical protein
VVIWNVMSHNLRDDVIVKVACSLCLQAKANSRLISGQLFLKIDTVLKTLLWMYKYLI